MKPNKLRQKMCALGWVLVRCNGKHFIYKKEDQTLSIPERKGKDINNNILRNVAKANNLTINQFKQL